MPLVVEGHSVFQIVQGVAAVGVLQLFDVGGRDGCQIDSVVLILGRIAPQFYQGFPVFGHFDGPRDYAPLSWPVGIGQCCKHPRV